MRKTAKGRHAEYVDNKLAAISIYEKKRLLDDRNAEGLPLIFYSEGDCFNTAQRGSAANGCLAQPRREAARPSAPASRHRSMNFTLHKIEKQSKKFLGNIDILFLSLQNSDHIHLHLFHLFHKHHCICISMYDLQALLLLTQERAFHKDSCKADH